MSLGAVKFNTVCVMIPLFNSYSYITLGQCQLIDGNLVSCFLGIKWYTVLWRTASSMWPLLRTYDLETESRGFVTDDDLDTWSTGCLEAQGEPHILQKWLKFMVNTQ